MTRRALDLVPANIQNRDQTKSRGAICAAALNFVRANEFQGAGDGTRTHDVQLGKLAFYQLNYARVLLS